MELAEMAGDWIKMRGGLSTSPRLWRLWNNLGITEERAFFLLYKLAAWFQDHGTYGKLAFPPSVVDGFLGVPGFASALIEIGWMRDVDGVLTLHSFCGNASRKSLGHKMREQVLGVGVCANCGCGGQLEIDHIIPVSRGGKCILENLQALCVRCNRSKGDKLPSEWMGGNG